jgi:predicted GTPase
MVAGFVEKHKKRRALIAPVPGVTRDSRTNVHGGGY